MPDTLDLDLQTSFTFRVAGYDSSRINSQVDAFTSESQTIIDKTDKSNAKSPVGKKRNFRELRILIGKIGGRRKTKAKTKPMKSSKTECNNNEAAASSSKNIEATQQQYRPDSEEVDRTFSTEARSDSPLLESSSSHKRKRFAGLWEDLDLAMEMSAEQMRAEKRARTVSSANPGQWEEFKENVGHSQSCVIRS